MINSGLNSKALPQATAPKPVADDSTKLLFKDGDATLRFIFQINAKDEKYLQHLGQNTYFSGWARDITGTKKHEMGAFSGNLVKSAPVVNPEEHKTEIAIFSIV